MTICRETETRMQACFLLSLDAPFLGGLSAGYGLGVGGLPGLPWAEGGLPGLLWAEGGRLGLQWAEGGWLVIHCTGGSSRGLQAVHNTTISSHPGSTVQVIVKAP